MTFTILPVSEGMTDDKIRELARYHVNDYDGVVDICRNCGTCSYSLFGNSGAPIIVDECNSCKQKNLNS